MEGLEPDLESCIERYEEPTMQEETIMSTKPTMPKSRKRAQKDETPIAPMPCHYDYLVQTLATPTETYQPAIVIDDPTYPIASKKNSHRRGWVLHLEAALRVWGFKNITILGSKDWSKGKNPYERADIIIISPPLENQYREGFNLYGGWNEDLEHKLQTLASEISKDASRFRSFARPLLKYSTLYDRKDCALDLGTKEQWKQFWMYWEANIISASQAIPSHSLALGDSHIISSAPIGSEIIRLDGKTLHGALQDGTIKKYATEHNTPLGNFKQFTHLTVYFGNIDIRHHIMRQDDPGQAIADLVKEYIAQLLSLLGYSTIQEINVISPLPIEHESRKIPATGFYKGTAFYGSWEHRNWAYQTFLYHLKNWIYFYNGQGYKINLLTLPENDPFLTLANELNEEVMEANSSVHLSPEFYRYSTQTGYDIYDCNE